MAYYNHPQSLEATMAGMNLQDEPTPSAPPPSAPPPQATPPSNAPPPYNPAMSDQPVLQQQQSTPNLSYGRPQDHRGSMNFENVPPQSSYWGYRQSYPSDDQRYMGPPRQPPPGGYGMPPPAQGGYGMPPPAQGGYGMPPPTQGGYGAVPPRPSYSMPPMYHQQPPYGVPPRPTFAPQPVQRVQYVSPCKPTGYNIMTDLFQDGNILFLIPKSSQHGLPLKTNWGKVIGEGSYNSSDSMFEVVVRQGYPQDLVISLKNQESSSRYICLNSKGEIKARNGSNANCEFHIRPVGSVESSVVCLESAANPGMFVGMKPNGSMTNAKSLVPSSNEAQFTIRAHRILNVYTSTLPLKAYGRVSVWNQVTDRSVIQLRNKASQQFLGIDTKGRVFESGDLNDQHALFMVFDRGMGVVSLRSWKHPGYWLKVTNGQVLGKGIPTWLDGDFNVKENYDGTVCLEPVANPGTYVAPPSSTSFDFTLTPVIVQ